MWGRVARKGRMGASFRRANDNFTHTPFLERKRPLRVGQAEAESVRKNFAPPVVSSE